MLYLIYNDERKGFYSAISSDGIMRTVATYDLSGLKNYEKYSCLEEDYIMKDDTKITRVPKQYMDCL